MCATGAERTGEKMERINIPKALPDRDAEQKLLADNYIRYLERMIDEALGETWESDGQGGWIGEDGTSLSRGEAFRDSRLVRRSYEN